jgi:hypothetical protein
LPLLINEYSGFIDPFYICLKYSNTHHEKITNS